MSSCGHFDVQDRMVLLFPTLFQFISVVAQRTHSGIDGKSVPAASSDRACLPRTGFVAGARFRNPD